MKVKKAEERRSLQAAPPLPGVAEVRAVGAVSVVGMKRDTSERSCCDVVNKRAFLQGVARGV